MKNLQYGDSVTVPDAAEVPYRRDNESFFQRPQSPTAIKLIRQEGLSVDSTILHKVAESICQKTLVSILADYGSRLEWGPTGKPYHNATHSHEMCEIAITEACRMATLGDIEVDDIPLVAIAAAASNRFVSNETLSSKQHSARWIVDQLDQYVVQSKSPVIFSALAKEKIKHMVMATAKEKDSNRIVRLSPIQQGPHATLQRIVADAEFGLLSEKSGVLQRLLYHAEDYWSELGGTSIPGNLLQLAVNPPELTHTIDFLAAEIRLFTEHRYYFLAHSTQRAAQQVRNAHVMHVLHALVKSKNMDFGQVLEFARRYAAS